MRRLGFSRGSSESGNKIDIIYNNCQLIRPARGGASAVTAIMHLRAKWPSVGLAVDEVGPWPVCECPGSEGRVLRFLVWDISAPLRPEGVAGCREPAQRMGTDHNREQAKEEA
jgi:hypothetical protein